MQEEALSSARVAVKVIEWVSRAGVGRYYGGREILRG